MLPVWDLGDLYASPHDSRLGADAELALEKAAGLGRRYAGRLAELDPGEMAAFMRAREKALALARKPSAYARLMGAATGHGPETEALQRLAEDLAGRISGLLRFAEREISALPPKQAEPLLNHPALAPWRRELALMRRLNPRPLTPEADAVLAALSPLFTQAHRALYETALSSGGPASISALAPDLQSPARRARTRAARLLAPRLAALAPQAAALLGLAVRKQEAMARVRGLAHAWEETRLASEIGLEDLESTVGEVLARTELMRRYLGLKKRLLGLSRLGYADLAASMPGASGRVSWNKAALLLRDAFAGVAPALGKAASRFLDNPWIHARPLPGKELGAFCLPTTPQGHPYLFMTWRGTNRCLGLMAHELGHGAHQLLSRKAGLFAQEPPFPWAEAVACFFELALGREQERRAASQKERLAALSGMLQSAFILVFRQAALFSFEHALHSAPEAVLDAPALGRLWAMCLGRVYGPPARAKGFADHWILIPHFLRLPGKVGDYVPAGLMGLAMFRRFAAGSAAFGRDLAEALAPGGSVPMAELAANLGLPSPGPELARQGLAAFADLLDRAETLA